MTKLVALKKFYYPRGGGGRDINPGEEFEVSSERDEKALVMSRRAKVSEKKKRASQPAAAPVENRDMTAEQPQSKPVEAMTTDDFPTKRVYQRRDMTSEK